jgi:hypothetical protein
MREDVELDDNLGSEVIYPDLPSKKQFGEAVVMLKNVSKGLLVIHSVSLILISRVHLRWS